MPYQVNEGNLDMEHSRRSHVKSFIHYSHPIRRPPHRPVTLVRNSSARSLLQASLAALSANDDRRLRREANPWKDFIADQYLGNRMADPGCHLCCDCCSSRSSHSSLERGWRLVSERAPARCAKSRTSGFKTGNDRFYSLLETTLQ